ncbi:hypothetical protein NP233_g1320 [Leucocoprinus birnbaumii]|uniref:Vacuolar protein sorting-associated protein 8 central domain-containing protein n=1 Tax=Leucocoprinus birnbaumii TaxID=56174 RepID=A0AAD5W086_9AGAR|nr:hypothetical protein NP233_g1320 [Leucocoprinus birnbaumii]
MSSSGNNSPFIYPSESHELRFSDSDEDDVGHNNDKAEDSFLAGGDYSSRMEEILDGDDDEEEDGNEFKLDSDDEDVEEGFLYTGVDAAEGTAASNYKARMREILGQDDMTDEEDVEVPKVVVDNEEAHPPEETQLPRTDSGISVQTDASTKQLQVSAPVPRKASSKIAKPFLHPNVSRLRSHSPHLPPSRTPEISFTTSLTNFHYAPSPSQLLNTSSSHTLSRVSSFSNTHSSHSPTRSPNLSSNSQQHLSHRGDDVVNAVIKSVEQEVFRWTNLHSISKEVYASSALKKAMTVLGAKGFETPTVLAANGYVCIGTSDGKILVYDFRQVLKCVCGEDSPGKYALYFMVVKTKLMEFKENRLGAVTALALSHDHTCVAAGYSTGYIQIYNLENPTTPIRTVSPTSLSLVYSGRKEGHIQGSRIISIGFVAGRHTAIVSADIYGLAFYHSLGKVLFVEATDILRILGRYPDPQSTPSTATIQPPRAGGTHTIKQRNPRYTILSMSPLPLGTSPHVTDAYSLVSILTPTKLVVVGLKPSPKTWFKVSRGLEEGGSWRSQVKWRGTLAWFPSVFGDTDGSDGLEPVKTNGKGKGKNKVEEQGTPTPPVLAFSWGDVLKVIRIEEVKVKQVLKNAKTGKEREVEVGAVDYRDVLSWSAEDEILGLQWLNPQQLVILTANQMGVYDLHASKMIEQVQFDVSTLMSPTIGHTVNGKVNYQDSVKDVAHSMRIYKGKIFLLGRSDIRVGTLLTWADRILSLVEDGDFLSAIELARSYYLDEAPGNRNGLPTDTDSRKQVIGDKLQDLMVASARYAFSEERMTDSTHVTPDGRGVDRTALFESLVTSCCHACIALDDTEFLFEELFQKYDDNGISAIYLRHLEPFMLDNEIRYVPPRITQRLISLHEEDGRPDLVERVIWHIDPECLDINQAIQLCQKHHLYDALIYVYTRALKDYVAPIVELLGLIRRVLIFRRTKAENGSGEEDNVEGETSLEPLILNSYKVYPYLAHVLYGLTYPSGEPLPEEEAFQAKKDIYTFLFYGRSSVWPPGEGGKLILTSDEEGGIEPTYPYVRQLLQWDAESFLHSLDIAFEDAYLHDETQKNINRLIIVRILLELIPSLSSEDATFVHIFIARNAPKYPKFLSEVLAPSILHKTLVHLSSEGKPENREDRQLAVEYLLSAYHPHDNEDVIALFEHAGFYRILRTWHSRDRRWDLLFLTYLDDPDMQPHTVFEKLDEVLTTGMQMNKRVLPSTLASTVEDTLSRLLELGVQDTASLLQKYLPQLHETALKILDDAQTDDKRFMYLQALLSPTKSGDVVVTPSPLSAPSQLRHMYIDLQCRFHPRETVTVLESLPSDFLEWDDVIRICESNQVHDAVIWAYDAQGQPQEALHKAVGYQRDLALQIVEAFREPSATDSQDGVEQLLGSLRVLGQRGVDICLRRSRKSLDVDVPLEDIWFTLLNSQINVVQLVSACQTSGASAVDEETKHRYLSDLRSLVQTTFGALVSITSTSVVSFPSLFKRLANSTTSTVHSHYDEFRTILTGMLESYRSDQDMLTMTKQLVEQDLFDTMAHLTRQKARGWTLERGLCIKCRNPLSKQPSGQSPTTPNKATEITALQIVVSRTGKAYHSQCYAD